MQWRCVRGVEVQLHPFVTFALDGSERSCLCLGHFAAGIKTPCTHWMEAVWVPELVWLLGEDRNLFPQLGTNPGPSSPQPKSLYWLSCPGFIIFLWYCIVHPVLIILYFNVCYYNSGCDIWINFRHVWKLEAHVILCWMGTTWKLCCVLQLDGYGSNGGDVR
jgi:hypothetical protein